MEQGTAASAVEGRWVPRGYQLLGRNGNAEVFGAEVVNLNGKTRVYAIGYSGRKTKSDWHHSFGTVERRAEFIADYFARLDAWEARKQERKAERSKPHTLKVGDILHTSWGYDQTNVEFYEVTKLVGTHMVELREIAQHYVETGFMSGRTRPRLGHYIGEPIRRKVRGDNNSCRIDDVRDAWQTTQHGEHFTSSYA